jgi:hypothetical protein
MSTTTTNNDDNDGDPTTQRRDRVCALAAREALFPLQIDWRRSRSHRTVFPAVEVLSELRHDLLDAVPASKLFPKRVVLVREIGSSELKWNGQPDISDDGTIEVIPQKLSVRCMECSTNEIDRDLRSFVRSRREEEGGGSEIVLCSNRLLRKDASTLLPERSDLPARTVHAVEEALAYEMSKIRDAWRRPDRARETITCRQLAAVELRAAQASACYLRRTGRETRRGSALPLGTAQLPPSWQRGLQDRCVWHQATKATARTFAAQGEAAACVDEVFDRVVKK